MDFARKQLEKYGWTDGKGLGKHENGISQALKPKLKRSVAGVGHDAASDFTEHWWNTLYDKAASNVQVEEKNGNTKKFKTKDNSDFEITNSMWRLKRKKKDAKGEEGYGDYFVKTAVLTGAEIETTRDTDSNSEDEKEKKDVLIKMTDEELFAACGGRTAHKGARFGLKATGKLARIKQQEEILLQQTKYNGYSHTKNIKDKTNKLVEDANLNSDTEVTGIKKKKKKKRKHCTSFSSDGKPETEVAVSEETMVILDENKKMSMDCSVANEVNNLENFRGINIEKSENLSGKKLKHKLSNDKTNEDLNYNVSVKKKKKEYR